MKKSVKTFFAIIFFLSLFVQAQSQKSSSKLKRSDCFFGIHFDLHASEDITDAGKTLTAEMIDTFLLKVRPDFIQIDCKGHPGISSYPTKVGFHVKGFEKDPLKLWREITEKDNVALFMHFSGVWDSKVVREHPDWAIIEANGERNNEKTSFFSPYLDTYMIPQLKELSDYKVDGAWIDGECWAVEPDYGQASLDRFAKETGITEIPKKQTDKYYPEFMEYTRRLFREHLNKYINAIHKYNPDFQITSNWSYSSMMPEKVTIDVDYLSGDVTPQNGVYRSAFEARCLAPQGKPWDLMAWGFSWDGGKMPMSVKSSVQLEQEAAQTLGKLEGALNLVLDNQHPVEILMEHTLTGKMNQYPLIIIPECDYLEPAFIEELRSYVKGGGNLMILGIETTKLFQKELGIKSLKTMDETQAFIAVSDKIGAIRSPLDSVVLNPEVKATSTFYEGSDFRLKGKMIASSVNNIGKGKIAAVYFNAGSDYKEYKSPVLRDFINSTINELFPDQLVTVSGTHLVHVTLNRLNDRMYVNLINIAGEHTNQNAIGYDEIPTIKDITVCIKTGQKPTQIILQPGGKELKSDFQNGVSKVVVPELSIHSILEVVL